MMRDFSHLFGKMYLTWKSWLLMSAMMVLYLPAFSQYVVSNHSLTATTVTQDRQRSLDAVLIDLEVAFDVSIVFDNTIIRGKKVDTANIVPNDLEKSLMQLLKPLGLESKKIEEKVYVIKPSKPQKESIKKLHRGSEVPNTSSMQTKPSVYLPQMKQTVKNHLVEKVISGQVTDFSTDESLPGVNVLVKDLQIGTVTDVDGNYRLTVPDDAEVLIFSFVGYITEEVSIGDQTEINVSLAPDIQSLEELVVVGYGTQKKVNLTGAVDVISSEQIESRQAPTVSQILQGQSPGLNFSVGNTGFQPGASMNIDIRGMGSLNGGSPLVLIDGFPGNMDRLNPNDIESVSVLKDAAASAIYGARAPYGVILITTKSGKKNEKLSISYSGNVSLNTPDRLPEMLDSYVFTRVVNEMGDNGGGRPYSQEAVDRVIAYQNEDWDYLRQFMPDDVTHYEAIPLSSGRWGHNQDNQANYDWYDEFFGHSINQKHDLSIRGGSDKTTYYVSGGYVGQEGVVNYGTDTYKRYNLTGKVNTAITDWLDFRYEARFMKSLREFPSLPNNWAYEMIFRQIPRTVPTQAKYDGYGNYANQSKIPFLEEAGSTLNETTESWNTLAAEIRPLPGWKINGNFAYRSFGYNQSDRNLTFYEPYADGRLVPFAGSVPSSIEERQEDNYYWSSNIYTSYDLTLNGRHNLMALVGIQYEYDNTKRLITSKTDLIVPDVPSLQTANGSITAQERLSHWATQGYFGRITYNFDEKYLFEANARYDGTSRFQEGSRWGFFPSFSVGWNVFKENFWQSIENYINTFKIRASWGQLGNQQVDPYLDLALIPLQAGQLNWLFNYGESRPIGYTSTPGLVSPNLTWETATTKNLGFNVSFLDDRLQAGFDVFERVTEDMIGPSEPVPGVLGSSVPSSNNATLRSRGWELSMRWNHNIVKSGLSYFVNLNLHDVKTVVTDYLNPSGLVSDWYPGKTVGEIWGYTAHDLFKSQEELDAYLEEVDMSFIFNNWYPGDLKYEDMNGDGAVNVGDNSLNDHGDLSIIGNSTPRYQFGLNAGLNYKGFDFSFLIQGTAKRDYSVPVSGEQYVFWGIRNWLFTAMTPAHLDYYRDQPGDKYVGLYEGEANINIDAYWPRPYLDRNQNNKNRQASTRYLLDASYLRLKNVQLGYNLPQSALDKIHLQRLRIFISGENVFTMTDLLKGIDPAALGPSNRIGMTYGSDKMFSIGINATL